MKTRKSTMIELVQELERVTPRTPLIQRMITEAKAGEYHDFKNKNYVCGKVAVVSLLTEAGQHELANRVKRGEFDETADEQDKEQMRKDFPKEMWPVLGL